MSIAWNAAIRTCAVVLAAACNLASVDLDRVAIDAAFAKYWDAKNPGEAAKAAEAIARSGAPFDEVHARLRLREDAPEICRTG
jgi:hypothetical protein